jgi:hypothetical protein
VIASSRTAFGSIRASTDQHRLAARPSGAPAARQQDTPCLLAGTVPSRRPAHRRGQRRAPTGRGHTRSTA